MARARATEVERQKVNEARRLDKERRMAIRTPRWEALLNSPDFSVGKVKKDMGLKRL